MDMALVKLKIKYQDIISLENLLGAWKEFIKGKKSKEDVEIFQRNLMGNVISLHKDLEGKTYVHFPYEAFSISDPKPRNIHKASVRDRLLHHAIYKQLYPYFDKRFINDSYSCRNRKGAHRAIRQFKKYTNKVSRNNTNTVWILKCDVKKFFASIDQSILFSVLSKHIEDMDVLLLLESVIKSFYSTEVGKGLPLGNLTSQLLVNIYMNEFDQFMKHEEKVKYYIRYADDFVIMNDDKRYLEQVLPRIDKFLKEKLQLLLHPNKVSISTLASGVDFLGWVNFPDHKVLRTVTKKRMMARMKDDPRPETAASYMGILKHGNTHKVKQEIERFKDVDSLA